MHLYLLTHIQLSKKLRSRRPTLDTIADRVHRSFRGFALSRCGILCNQKGLAVISAQPFGVVVEEMVELIGIEPTTLCLQSRCSPS